MENFDLIIIGAGPAGYVGAIRAAQLGMSVAIVEKQYLGGTCLNVGCIPSKALLDTTHEVMRAKSSYAPRGIRVGDVSVDLAALLAFKEKTVRQLTGGIGALLKKNKINHIVGDARLLSATTVEVKGDKSTQTLTARRILIATGSLPVDLPAAKVDGDRIVDSTGALKFEAVPARLIVIGAGAIGLELGSVWSRLGSDVTVVEFLDRIAPASDGEMAGQLKKALEKQGLKFRLSTRVMASTIKADGVHLTVESGGKSETLVADRVLVSVGRKPATASLGLEELGVKLSTKRFVEVGEHFETAVPGVFAVGDCIGGAMLAHKASDEAVACVEQMAGVGGEVNYEAIPSIIYTAPELACVGMGEEQAKVAGHSVKVGKFPFTAIGRARCMDDTEGAVKIIADAATDRVLGVSVLHSHASDLIAEAAIAMEYKASAEDIARSAHAHPTLAEAMKEAALAVDGRQIHL